MEVCVLFGLCFLVTVTIGSGEILFPRTGLQPHHQLDKRYPIHIDPLFISLGGKLWIKTGECPKSIDGHSKYLCPSPSEKSIGPSRWICIEDWQVCDGVEHCPNGEDEDLKECMFFKVIQTQLDILTATVGRADNGNVDEESFKFYTPDDNNVI